MSDFLANHFMDGPIIPQEPSDLEIMKMCNVFTYNPSKDELHPEMSAKQWWNHLNLVSRVAGFTEEICEDYLEFDDYEKHSDKLREDLKRYESQRELIEDVYQRQYQAIKMFLADDISTEKFVLIFESCTMILSEMLLDTKFRANGLIRASTEILYEAVNKLENEYNDIEF